MTKDEALKMAIEALLYGTDHTKAVKACKEALEQPTQGLIESIIGKQRTYFTALEQPKEWQGLSDDELEEAFVHTLPYEYGHAIEAKLKEKNNG